MNISTSVPAVGLPLRINFSWSFLGNLVYAACQWGMLIVLAKLGTPTIVGQFSLGLAVSAPVYMLTNLQLRAVQATDAKGEYGLGLYLALRLVCTVVALLLVSGLVVWSGYKQEMAFVILLLSVAKGIESISDIFYGVLQQRERMDKVAISMMMKGGVSLGALGMTMYMTGSVVWSVMAMTIAWGVLLFVYDIPAVQWLLAVSGQTALGPDLRAAYHQRRQLRRLAWLSAPLGIVMMLISLNTSIPRFFLAQYQGEYILGIFSAMLFLTITGTTVVQALGQSAVPRLATHYIRGERADYMRLVFYLVGIGIVLALCGIGVALVGGELLLRIVYAPEYAQYSTLFVLIMVVGGIQYVASLLSHTMTAARYFNVQIWLFIAVTATTALACAWLVPTQGIMGAALALLAAAIVQLLGCLLINLYAVRQLRKIELGVDQYE